jgi:peptidoglycan/xylan/chitin deacetylase (PgdA/CDA1 family)
MNDIMKTAFSFLFLAIMLSACNYNDPGSVYDNRSFTFPEGKHKALVLSYDDGLVHDRKMVAILNKYKIRGTFHLNSAKLGASADWLAEVYGEGSQYVKPEEIQSLYENHEVASHTANHPHLFNQPDSLIKAEVEMDIEVLEKLTGKPVKSLAYPFGDSDKHIASILEQTAITNARTINNTYGFGIPENFLLWHPTCHNTEAHKLVDTFKQTADSIAIFYIWGHSWEFDGGQPYNSWEYLEELCEQLAGDTDVWYTTAGLLADYLLAMKELEYTGARVTNNSEMALYLKKEGKVIELLPGKSVRL